MSLDTITDALGKAQAFAGLDSEQLRLLAFSSERKTYTDGAVLYESGTEPEGAFVLVSGKLSVIDERGDAKPTSVEEPYSTVGEMALILTRPRPTTVKADGPCDVIFVPRQGYRKLLDAYPELARAMANKLQSSLGQFLNALEPTRKKIQE